MVGGVADWFAITALFRRPLNLPIPHTAIIPSRKDRIGRSLGNFVQNNFLSPEVLGAKLRAAQLSRRAAEWLREPEHARTVVRQAAGGAPERHRRRPGRRRARAAGAERDRAAQADGRSPRCSRAGWRSSRPNDRHQQLLDRVVHGLARLVAENEELIRERIREESPWWVPEFVDDKLHDKDRRRDRADPVRGERGSRPPAAAAVRRAAGELDRAAAESPEVIARAEAIKQQVLDNPTSDRLTESLWRELKQMLDRQVDAAERGTPGGLERGLSALAEAALEDEALLAKIDELDHRRGAPDRGAAPARGGAAHRAHRERVGSGRDLAPDRAPGRPGPAVHPDQRHAGGRAGGAGAVHGDADGGARSASRWTGGTVIPAQQSRSRASRHGETSLLG